MPIFTRTTLSAITVLTVFAAMPAQAATHQEDVQTCRVAMTNQGAADMNAYRLRFEYAKGNSKGRTIYLKAIPTQKDASGLRKAFRLSCTLKKNTVVALNVDNSTRFVKR